jgi:hypothetical protein
MPKGSNATAVAENARLSALTTPPVDLSMEAQLARMPTGIPNVQARTIPGGYWFNPGEALITTSFRPEKKFIGLTRVCGLMPSYVKDLLQNKPPNSQVLPIQFEDLCSTDEFLRLRTQSTATELSQPTVSIYFSVLENEPQTLTSKNRSLDVPGGLRASSRLTAHCSEWLNIFARTILSLSSIHRLEANLPGLRRLATLKIPNGPIGLALVTIGMHQTEFLFFLQHAKISCP